MLLLDHDSICCESVHSERLSDIFWMMFTIVSQDDDNDVKTEILLWQYIVTTRVHTCISVIHNIIIATRNMALCRYLSNRLREKIYKQYKSKKTSNTSRVHKRKHIIIWCLCIVVMSV